MSGVLLVGNVGFLLWTIFDTAVVFKSLVMWGLSDARRAILVWKNHEVGEFVCLFVYLKFQATFILVASENKRTTRLGHDDGGSASNKQGLRR